MKPKNDILKNLENNIPAELRSSSSSTNQLAKKPDDLLNDYEYTRTIHRKLIDKSNEAIDSLMDLALDAEHPRAYEVLSNMLKNTSDMTDKLVDLQTKMKKIKLLDEDNLRLNSGNNIQNNLFVGSTEELQRFLKQQQQQNARVISDD